MFSVSNGCFPDLLSLDDVEIHYLPIGSAPDLQKKSKYKRAFDVVYFSNS